MTTGFGRVLNLTPGPSVIVDMYNVHVVHIFQKNEVSVEATYPEDETVGTALIFMSGQVSQFLIQNVIIQQL